MTGVFLKITSAASSGSSGSVPRLIHEAGSFVKKTAASAMKAMRTDAVRTVDRVRWRSWPLDRAASLERARVVDLSDTVLLIVDGKG
jgi:hypothetical protein